MKRRKRHFTKSREEIEWYPTIDSKLCNNCKSCYNFCFKKVFALNEKGFVFVAKPYECVVLCQGCENKCPKGAISFPKKEEFAKFVVYEE
jgi:NAD-dependent dihydropyrimidine dehydrogenase PreA subunit